MSNASNSDSDTKSLDSDVMEKTVIHGREYQPWSMDRGASYQPIDEIELERQDKIYEALHQVFEKKLFFPIGMTPPKQVLDCGFGIGSWAIEVAEIFPDCEVLGIDVSPHLKPDVQVENLTLQIDDLNDKFTFDLESFDLVHSQGVVTGIKKSRWPGYISDCVSVLKPEGWLQFVEFHLIIQSDNGRLTDSHAITQLNDAFVSAVEDDRDLRVPTRFHTLFRSHGLESVEVEVIRIPLNGWYLDNPLWKAHGERFGAAFFHGLEGSVMVHLTRAGVSAEQVRVLIAQARHELEDISLKPYISLYVAIGRKPDS